MTVFKVRGWIREIEGSKVRKPLKLKTVEAPDGKAAAHYYAEQWYPGMNLNEWWEVGPSPLVVIRVSNLEDQDP